MEKIAIILLSLGMISVGFLSGCTQQQPIQAIKNLLTASCSANITTGNSPLSVSFVGTGTDLNGDIVSYSWDFGDGTHSTEQNPIHTFISTGIYNVTFTVADNNGAIGTNSTTITIQAKTNQAPTASTTAYPYYGTAPLTVQFTGSGTDMDGYIVSYYWNFGDGTTSNKQSPSHTFTSVKKYTVTLTVTDNNGSTGQDTENITVTQKGNAEFRDWLISVSKQTETYSSYCGIDIRNQDWNSLESDAVTAVSYIKTSIPECGTFSCTDTWERIQREFYSYLNDSSLGFYYAKLVAIDELNGDSSSASTDIQQSEYYINLAKTHMDNIGDLIDTLPGL